MIARNGCKETSSTLGHQMKCSTARCATGISVIYDCFGVLVQVEQAVVTSLRCAITDMPWIYSEKSSP